MYALRTYFSLVIVVRFRVDYSFTTDGPRGKMKTEGDIHPNRIAIQLR